MIADVLSADAGGQSFTLLLWGALLGLSGFVGILIKQGRADAQQQINEANERTKIALLAGAATAKEERDRADEREKSWLTKLDRVAATQEELDENVSNIHLLIDGLIRTIREREQIAPPETPTPSSSRRRVQGGD